MNLNKIKISLYLLLFVISMSAHSVEVSKSDWINAVSTALPTAFCKSSLFFRQCFNVTAQECEKTAATATRVCLNKYEDKMPATLIQPKDGSHWGTIVGACAGKAYELSLTKERINNSKCNNPENWK